jgi:two-component system phosphate regulon sensor histidine kinase PhoR
MRLRSRFTLLFGVLAILTAVALLWIFDRTLKTSLEDRVTERLTRELEHLADDLARLPAPETDAFLRRAAGRLGARLTLVGADGVVLHETGLSPADVAGMDNHGDREEIREALAGGTGKARRQSATQQREMLYLARRLEGARVLRAAVSEATLRGLQSAYLLTSRAAVLLACLVLFLVGAAASSRFSRPIGELTRAASAIARGEFHRSLPAAGGEELQVLGGALQDMKDGMARALDRAESERRLTATVFESLPDGLVVVDAKLHVVEANERFSRLIGIPSPAGRALWDLLRHRPLLECFEATLEGGEVSSRVVRLADDIVWEVLVAPLPEGSRAAAVGVLRDITRLERTESMRRTFVADVSHELRTPIASIAAAAETLADGDTEKDDQATLVSVIRRQAEHMRELIDDLTDLSQIESGSVPLERARVDLLSLLRDVAQELEPAAREKQVTLRVSGDAGATAIGDRRRLGQVARNLLDNAIKFSPAGSPVELEARLRDGAASLTVTDRGPGIPRAERDKIFQRFYQVDRSRSKRRPGTGLGLAIVKHIVHLHGATVEVDGEVGRGSTFRVLFPAPGEGRETGIAM